jgi:hypothetical protein
MHTGGIVNGLSTLQRSWWDPDINGVPTVEKNMTTKRKLPEADNTLFLR